MPKKNFTTQEIVSRLRKAEVLLSQSQALETICRGLDISQQTSYRWPRTGRIWRDAQRSGAPPERAGAGEGASQEVGRRSLARQCDGEGGTLAKMTSPAKRRQAVEQLKECSRSRSAAPVGSLGSHAPASGISRGASIGKPCSPSGSLS
jgi:hypothetical protein